MTMLNIALIAVAFAGICLIISVVCFVMVYMRTMHVETILKTSLQSREIVDAEYKNYGERIGKNEECIKGLISDVGIVSEGSDRMRERMEEINKSLQNKIAASRRWERKPREEETEDDDSSIPGTVQQEIGFPGFSEPEKKPVKKRKFGSM